MTDPTEASPVAGWYNVDGNLHYWDGAAWLNIPSPPKIETPAPAPEQPAAVPTADTPTGPASAIGFDDLDTAPAAPAARTSTATSTRPATNPATMYQMPPRRRGLPTAVVVAITAATTAAAIVGGYFAWQYIADAPKREDIAAVEQTIAASVRNGEQSAPAAVDDVTCTPVNSLFVTSILDCTVTLSDGAGSIPWYAWTNHDTGESWHGIQPFPLIAAAWD